MAIQYPKNLYWKEQMIQSNLFNFSANTHEISGIIGLDKTQLSGITSNILEVSSAKLSRSTILGITGIESGDRLNLLRDFGTTTGIATAVQYDFINELENISTKITEYNENDLILNQLMGFSSKLKHIENDDEKIQTIIDLNKFIKKYKDIIKENFPDTLVSILNSL